MGKYRETKKRRLSEHCLRLRIKNMLKCKRKHKVVPKNIVPDLLNDVVYILCRTVSRCSRNMFWVVTVHKKELWSKVIISWLDSNWHLSVWKKIMIFGTQFYEVMKLKLNCLVGIWHNVSTRGKRRNYKSWERHPYCNTCGRRFYELKVLKRKWNRSSLSTSEPWQK